VDVKINGGGNMTSTDLWGKVFCDLFTACWDFLKREMKCMKVCWRYTKRVWVLGEEIYIVDLPRRCVLSVTLSFPCFCSYIFRPLASNILALCMLCSKASELRLKSD
jgi:hypothetical protein